ncbi:MAG: methyltransferase domain-containing protein [Pseudomonadota bacterium]
MTTRPSNAMNHAVGGNAFDRFYQSPRGHETHRAITAAIAELWGEHLAEVCVLGYGAPFDKDDFNAHRMIGLQPACLPPGLVAPPESSHSQPSSSQRARPSAPIVMDARLPLTDGCLDRLVMLHCLEFSTDPGALLREAWRVLNGEGRLMIVAPHRLGLWARAEDTPFGHGRPYSLLQLQNLLAESMLTYQGHRRALTTPPRGGERGAWLVAAFVIRRWFRQLAGVIVIDARKELLSPVIPARRSFTLSPLSPSLSPHGAIS